MTFTHETDTGADQERTSATADGHRISHRIRARPIPPTRSVDRAARRILLGVLDRTFTGGPLLLVEPTGTRRFGSDDATTEPITVEVHTPAVYASLLRDGSAGLGETYIDGWWDCEDVPAFIRSCVRNLDRVEVLRNRFSGVTEAALGPVRRFRRASKSRDRRNIQAHYDLGNDFFELFLDPTMMYSSAVFDHVDQPLEDASIAKLERLCTKLDLGPDDHLLEIGTGWGGMAVYAARTRGCRVSTTTISHEQFLHAKARVEKEGAGDLVTVLDSDYRDLSVPSDGPYTKAVSIEMIEAVDWRDYDSYFQALSDLVAPDGLIALQAIIVPDQRWVRTRSNDDFITRFVFPGGCLASLGGITESVARSTDCWVYDVDDIGAHYAETLRRWRANLSDNAEAVEALGYGGPFLRLWNMYLSMCEAVFAERTVSVCQVVLAKPAWRPGELRPRLS